jgi:drug/metabolite transporter (DMT)-like permease
LGVVSIWNGSLFGNLVIGLAVVSFSLYSVLSKKYQDIYSPMILTKYFVVTTIITQLALMSFHLSSSFALLQHISLKVWLVILYAGILDTTLFYFLYQYVVKRASPVLASMTFYLQPISTIILARLIFNEKMTTTFFIGSLLIFLGITLVFHEKYFGQSKVNS